MIFDFKLSDHYKKVFSTPEGKKVLYDLMKFGKFNQPTYSPGDPNGTAFNEGMRRVILRIVNFVEADLENQMKLHTKLMNEDMNNE